MSCCITRRWIVASDDERKVELLYLECLDCSYLAIKNPVTPKYKIKYPTIPNTKPALQRHSSPDINKLPFKAVRKPNSGTDTLQAAKLLKILT